MADYRHESNPARRSEIAAQLIAKRDAASQPVAFAPRASGAPAPRSTSAASALVAQMIATAEPAARADLAARVCASLQAALGTDDALARYASERDPAKRSEIAQQIIAAREHSAGQSELRALLIRFESAHSLETRAGIFHQVTIAARRCGLL